MTAAFLQSELASLIQDSKRRQSDVRTSAEKSLADLKAIQVTSETQLAADLLRRPQFVDPFILACNSKYVKLAVTGAVCLQRLVASKAVAPSRLGDMLDAFQEATSQGLDVQLKVLQALPSLLQLYTSELQGSSLGKVLSLCASLAGNKTGLVSSTAIATFQQLISTLFEKHTQSGTADGGDDSEDSDDVANVFNDMCMIVGGEAPQFLRSQGLTLAIALEVIELSLSNVNFAVLDIPSCAATCEAFLIPGINQVLEKSTNFSVFGRALRTLYLLITRELDRTLPTLPDTFATILHIMDRPSGPGWRRVLCLEFMKNIIADPQLFRAIYALFDSDGNRKNVIGDLMSILVRIAAEDPALIGLGRQSTIPTNIDNDSTSAGNTHMEVDVVGSVLQAGSNVTGISSRWSTLESPLLEQLEKSNVPDIPATYIYTLVLGCVASVSDGLSKFVMPLSVPTKAAIEAFDAAYADGVPTRKNSTVRKAEKYQRLLNPLKREDLADKRDVQVCAKMIEDCWPAVLATCSTFLNSALDSHFYHILVRTVQKLAQVSGVLELFTPRDALLTTLAKVSVPVNASSLITALHGSRLAKVADIDEGEDSDDDTIKSPSITSPTSATPKLSIDVSRQQLNVRNLLCLRALINLGIALGPSLTETSWSIIIQALQQADALMSANAASRTVANKTQSQDEVGNDGQTSLGSEITAVATASKRMLESTRTYLDETLLVFFNSVFRLVDSISPDLESKQNTHGKKELKVATQQHKASRSFSGSVSIHNVLYIEVEFVLKTINDLARVNLHRFCSTSSKACSWDLLVLKLLAVVGNTNLNAQLRLQASNILNAISTEVARVVAKHTEENEEVDQLQRLCLDTLAKQLSLLYKKIHVQNVLVTDVEIHRRLLEALENIVSNSGESLTSGWPGVFDILQRTTRQAQASEGGTMDDAQHSDRQLVLERTISPAFRTVQLIVADFLNTIDPLSFSILVQLLPSFGLQENDLNISLTTTVLFSNLSTLLCERTDTIAIPTSYKHPPERVQNGMVGTEQEATDVSSLWFAIVLKLCLLCKDDRPDVRNSALRVLIRVLESSSPQLSAESWDILLEDALLPVLAEYSSKDQDTQAWHTSYTQLLQGIVSLFVQNTEVITRSTAFVTTWRNLISALQVKLIQQTLEGDTVVFASIAQLLQALPSSFVEDAEFLRPVLRSWCDAHPARLSSTDISNQDALYAHARLFTITTQRSRAIAASFSTAGNSLTKLAMAASKRAILSSIHPPYTNDVSKIASEQAAIVENMMIVQQMMAKQKLEFSLFLLDLISCMLARNMSTTIDQQKLVAGSRNLKQPTLVALMSKCITIFRNTIRGETEKPELLKHIPMKEALLVLKAVVDTKYTDVPSTGEFPAWQNATAALVELVEALQQQAFRLQADQVKDLSYPAVDALKTILICPALETKQPPPSPEVIVKDQTFDIEHFSRFHIAATTLFGLPDFPNQARKQYTIVIFQAALIAKPWFNDLPPDLLNKPLATLNKLRQGSIRTQDFMQRAEIPYHALNALLGLVDRSPSLPQSKLDLTTASAASSYVLLRLAHPIKVFLADQWLRQLTPPPRQVQHELRVVLDKALQLRVVDEAFTAGSTSVQGAGDGKSHLRILYPLILQLKEFWADLPRLKVCPWQDSKDGVAIKAALDAWGRMLAEGWGMEGLI